MNKYEEAYNGLYRGKAKEKMTGMAGIDDYPHRLTIGFWPGILGAVVFVMGLMVYIINQ